MGTLGLELLFALESRKFSQPQDALVCFIHWELISRGWKCLGKGETSTDGETESERMPDGWSDNKELYTLRYRRPSSTFLLKALTVDGALFVNAMDLKTEQVYDVTLNVDANIDSAHLQQHDRVYKNLKDLIRQLDTELISPLIGFKEEKKASPQQPRRPQDYDPLRIPPRRPASNTTVYTDPLGHFPYGASDLDPLGGRSGGMIMDPFHAGRTRPRPGPPIGLPPGAVPPGARFDPFGPLGSRGPGVSILESTPQVLPPFVMAVASDLLTPGLGQFGLMPDPDHLTPPGYDDMFM